MADWYDVVVICENGHLINADGAKQPETSAGFCGQCGAKAMSACEKCGENIRGSHWEKYDLWPGSYNRLGFFGVPAYCRGCGKPYPWTETAVREALLLGEQETAWDQPDPEAFKEAVPELVKETPKTPRAMATMKRLLGKAGGATVRALERILAGLACEAVKHEMWPNL